jgi:tetratricopeptide (TPR) repeat protein
MLMAVKAGVPGFEQTEWCRVMLGHLHENTGDLPGAEALYQESLQLRPGYAYALAGLARVARARKDYAAAIKHLQLARAQVSDYAFTDELTDLYRLSGEQDKADETAQQVIKTLKAHANTEDEDDSEGHYTDRELAYAYLKAGELDLALQHARTEYERRPTNIDVCETMAWVHYRRGEFKDAQRYIKQARRTGCQNPQLLYRAGSIAVRNGDIAGGQALLRQARKLNPYLQTDPTESQSQLVAAQ